jgi:hypothetical protein
LKNLICLVFFVQIQSLLGYDADTDPSVIAAFETDDQAQLPGWATKWSGAESKEAASCESGNGLATQCNPLGMVGLWVMKKTEPKYNKPSRSDDAAKMKNCLNLPGWALRECMKMREKESKM